MQRARGVQLARLIARAPHVYMYGRSAAHAQQALILHVPLDSRREEMHAD